MRYFCPACGTAHTKADEEIPAGGMSVECSKCGFSIRLKPPKRPAAAAGAGPTQVRPAAAAKTEPTMPAAAEPSAEDLGPGEGEPEPVQEPEPAQEPQPEPEPELQPEPEAAPAPAKAKRAPKKTRAPRPAGPPAASWPYFGTGRSGDRFRFRDLFVALQVPLDLRKTAVAGAFVFAGSALLILVGWLASLVHSPVANWIGLILGALLYLGFLFAGLGVAAHQADQEMQAGGRLPMAEGLGFLKAHPLSVIGFPFLFVLGMVGLGVGIAVFHLLARIPYAGPILFGLGYSAVFVLALGAVLLGILLVFSFFSYIPAAGRLGPLELARHLWALLRRRPGWYSLHLLVASAVVFVLYLLLSWVLGASMAYIGQVGGWVGGGEYTTILLSMPGGLFPLFELLFDSGLSAGIGAGWQFAVAGWLVFAVWMAIFSLVQGFVLTYFLSAGVVNYRLLTQDEQPPA